MKLPRLLFPLLLLTLAACSSDGDGGDSGQDPPDAAASASAADGGPGAADAGGGGSLEFMASCEVANDQCDMAAGEFCFSFNNKGPHCTHDCGGDGDCEAPSPGCNGMGVCKAP